MTDIYQRLGGGEKFDTVITECLNSCRFMPTIAEIRERAGLLSEGQQKAAAGEAAWDYIRQYVRKWYGLPGAWEKLPEAIDRAVRAVGGISAIAEADVERIGFVRRDFLEAYRNAPAANEYVQRQGWALPEAPQFRKLTAGMRMEAPTESEAAAAIAKVTRAIEAAPSAPVPIQRRVMRGPLTENELAEKRRQAVELEKTFTDLV